MKQTSDNARRALFGRLWSGVTTLLCLSLFAVGTPAFGQGGPPRPPGRPPAAQSVPRPSVSKDVKVEMMVVYATNSGDKVDPDLQSVMQQLRFTRYRSFTRLETHPATLEVGQESTFSIAGGRRVALQLLSRDDTQAKLRMRMFNDGGKLLDTTVSIHRNRAFMVAGPRYEDGVLILPVTVKY